MNHNTDQKCDTFAKCIAAGWKHHHVSVGADP